MGVFDSLKQMFGGGGKTSRVNIKERFELFGKSGQGSMSRVHRAKDRENGNRVVCIKILDMKKLAEFEARFVGLKRPPEGEICVGFDHKNIVKTFEHGLTTEGEQFLVMEWLDGKGLQSLLEVGGVELNGKRISCLVQLAEGLEYLHEQKYLHRDICPRNIIVGKKGEIKYIDFGLTIPYKPEFCKPGNRTGTANYLAPEIIKRLTTDHRVDLFALGVMSYEIVTNTLPWEKSATIDNLLRVMNQPAADPREHRKDLDEATARLLLRACERDPNKRFQTATEYREALQALPKKNY